MSERKSTSIWIWILAIVAIILLFALGFVLGKSKSVSYSDIDNHVQSEVTKLLYEQDSILTKQVQKCVDTCPVNINVNLCRLDSCTKTEIKYLVSEASRENLSQYINAENNHLTWLAIIIAALVSIVGIGIPLFLNADMKRQIRDIQKKVEEAEKVKEATVQAKVDAEKANEEAKESEKSAKVSKLFAEALAEKDLDKQIELYSEILELDPNSAAALINRGVTYDNKGNHNQAIEDYDEAIRINPKYAEAYYNRGTAYLHKGNCDQAIKDYDEAIKLNPKDAEAFSNRGSTFVEKGNYDQAIKDYDEAIRLNPKSAELYANRGSAYSKKGDYDQAIKDLDEAIRLNPNIVGGYCNRGMTYSRKNKLKLAIDDFEKAVDLQPDENNNFNLDMGYIMQAAITFKEKKVIKKARDKAQEGLKKAEEAKDKDWVKIFQKFLDELPPED